jgi:hypothetical protein
LAGRTCCGTRGARAGAPSTKLRKSFLLRGYGLALMRTDDVNGDGEEPALSVQYQSGLAVGRAGS